MKQASPTARMCLSKKLEEEEREAFPNNSSSFKIFAPVHCHCSLSFPSSSACVCSCETSVVGNLERAWHIQPLY